MKLLITFLLIGLSHFNLQAMNNPISGRKGFSVNTVVFSPDSTKLLLSLNDSTAKVLDASSGDVLLNLKGHKKRVNTAFFSPDGSRIITSSDDMFAKVWNALTGELIYEIHDEKLGIQTAKYSPDGKFILTVSANTINIWNSDNAKLIYKIELTTSGIFTDACFSADNNFIYSASTDNSVNKWIIGYDKPMKTMIKHKNKMIKVCASADGKYLISKSLLEEFVCVWDAKECFLVCTIPNQSVISTFSCSSDGKFLLVNNSGPEALSIIQLSDCSIKFQSEFDMDNLTGYKASAFSPNGRVIVTISSFGEINYLDSGTGKLLKKLIE
jgi:uncharacterized protein with WD repeat